MSQNRRQDNNRGRSGNGSNPKRGGGQQEPKSIARFPMVQLMVEGEISEIDPATFRGKESLTYTVADLPRVVFYDQRGNLVSKLKDAKDEVSAAHRIYNDMRRLKKEKTVEGIIKEAEDKRRVVIDEVRAAAMNKAGAIEIFDDVERGKMIIVLSDGDRNVNSLYANFASIPFPGTKHAEVMYRNNRKVVTVTSFTHRTLLVAIFSGQLDAKSKATKFNVAIVDDEGQASHHRLFANGRGEMSTTVHVGNLERLVVEAEVEEEEASADTDTDAEGEGEEEEVAA